MMSDQSRPPPPLMTVCLEDSDIYKMFLFSFFVYLYEPAKYLPPLIWQNKTKQDKITKQKHTVKTRMFICLVYADVIIYVFVFLLIFSINRSLFVTSSLIVTEHLIKRLSVVFILLYLYKRPQGQGRSAGQDIFIYLLKVLQQILQEK